MTEQYWQVRNSLDRDTILLFRLGDFYEMFFEDAIEGSKILSITLTKRQNFPMAGIPYHASEQYIPKLLAAGKKVAICEQDEIPRAGKLVKRSVSRILTPGTTLEDSQLVGNHSNFIMAFNIDAADNLYASWLDLSTAEFYCAQFDHPEDFLPILSACDPKEILLPETESQKWAQRLPSFEALMRSIIDLRPVTKLHDFRFEPSWGAAQMCDTMGVLSLEGFGIEKGSPLSGPAGALIFYATENLRARPQNIKAIRKFAGKKCVLIDPATQRSLELFKSNSGLREGSLLAALDNTSTNAGARLLESYLASPTLDIDEIRRRQNIVWELYCTPSECDELENCFESVRDLPRILARLQNRLRAPRELLAVLATIEQFPAIKRTLEGAGKACAELAAAIADFSDLEGYLRNALNPDMPAKIQDGGVIRDGFDKRLDDLRHIGDTNMTWLAELERAEQERTGIKNLRIKYNGAFGYFIEITKSALDKVPADYIRRQTMTNAERFTTEDLRQKEREILHSQDEALAREDELFGGIVAKTLEFSDALAEASHAVSQADVFRGWAQIARTWDYCKPDVNTSDAIEITDGRHPVVEQMLKRDRLGLARTESFVPNDAYLDSTTEQIALITGPNMAGKSTYIRQIALITLMAQIGSFVPAKKCSVGLVDRIFSRVGASDELSKGNSTFMVEMNETANILNNATPRSLIVLDEIGRGTSTYDGLSIAWAVAEFIHGEGKLGPKTLFATHYHEITKLEETLPRLVNYRVCVKEWNDDIIFVRKIERGCADKSYGIQVARLAGLPQKVIERAKTILSELESEGNLVAENLGQKGVQKPKRPPKRGGDEGNFKQLSLF